MSRKCLFRPKSAADSEPLQVCHVLTEVSRDVDDEIQSLRFKRDPGATLRTALARGPGPPWGGERRKLTLDDFIFRSRMRIESRWDRSAVEFNQWSAYEQDIWWLVQPLILHTGDSKKIHSCGVCSTRVSACAPEIVPLQRTKTSVELVTTVIDINCALPFGFCLLCPFPKSLEFVDE